MMQDASVMIVAVASGLVCAGTTALLLPQFLQMLRNSQWVKPNYRGEQIPQLAGVVLVLVFVFACLLLRSLGCTAFDEIDGHLRSLQTLALGMAFIGLLDDTVGSRSAGGFTGHLKKWASGELTTGVIKMAAGFAIALECAAWGDGVGGLSGAYHSLRIMMQAMVIALSANWINLLDLRPGRALKVAMAHLVLLLCLVPSLLFIPVLMLGGLIAAYFPFDVKAKCMMGDTGANFIGAVLGYLTVQYLDLVSVTVVLASLVGLHIYTEFHSLSRVIEQNGILTWIDGLGREEA